MNTDDSNAQAETRSRIMRLVPGLQTLATHQRGPGSNG